MTACELRHQLHLPPRILLTIILELLLALLARRSEGHTQSDEKTVMRSPDDGRKINVGHKLDLNQRQTYVPLANSVHRHASLLM